MIAKLLVVIISIHLMSQVFMTTRATAQVALKPIRPPYFWRYVFPAKEYLCVDIMVSTPIWVAFATISLSSNSVLSAAGNIQFSSLPGLALTPGLTPFLVKEAADEVTFPRADGETDVEDIHVTLISEAAPPL